MNIQFSFSEGFAETDFGNKEKIWISVRIASRIIVYHSFFISTIKLSNETDVVN